VQPPTIVATPSPEALADTRSSGSRSADVAFIASRIPNRMALAGGWIDQPIVSRHNPAPPGSMVVVALEPAFWFMDRCGMASSPHRPRADLVRELYWAENDGKAEPSGSQDMIGLLYPGVNRLDYDEGVEGGRFPVHVESNCDPEIARWVEEVFHLVPINQRPAGYSPLGIRNLNPEWIAQLGQTGKDCFDAIVNTDLRCLGAAMNHCMRCWEAILPHTVQHPAISLDLKGILSWFQSRYAGAMYSGCGGGYMIVVSEEPVPGSLRVRVRIG
jgi:hypothetical protein